LNKAVNIGKKEMPEIQCIIIGGSAGSVGVIYKILNFLPADYPVPVLIVLHRGKQFQSNLQDQLQMKARIHVKEVDEKDKLQAGTAYLAPADFHLLIEPDKSLSLDASEPVLYCRPAMDVTFYSAADVFGSSLAVILLSGANNDGAAGGAYVKDKGGTVVIQDPSEAEVDTMPKAGIRAVKHPLILDSDGIMAFIEQISGQKKVHLS
jgi:two-component system chemotaxis response regulator CheB